MTVPQLMTAVLLALVALMGGCTSPDYRPVSSSPTYPGTTYGVIDMIEVGSGDSGGIAGSGIGAGTVIGGVVGGVLGHQVGKGSGQDIATGVGVVGGALVGHEIEKRNQQQQETYRIRVRLENGGYLTVTQPDIGGLRVGDRVRIENDRLYGY